MSDDILDNHFRQKVEDYPNANDYDEKLHGLKGWLLFLGIAIVFSFFTTLLVNAKNYLPIIKQFDLYSQPQKLWISLEFVLVLSIIVYKAFLVFYFFNKKKLFPKLFIWHLLYIITFNFLEQFLIFPMMQLSPNYATFTQPIIYAVVWSLYIIQSLRVKHTFVFK